MNFTLPNELTRALRSRIPTRSRSKLVARAIKNELDKTQIKKISLEMSLKINKQFYAKVAKDWQATELEGWPK